MTGRIGYPFEPKSIARLTAGQFWAVPLSDGRHSCGRVLHVPGKADSLYLNARIFLAGLMDWSGSGPPTSEAIAGRGILAQGMMHVAAIRDTKSLIIGQRDLGLDGLTGLREISHRAGGTVWLYQGGQRLRPATGEERRTLPVMSGGARSSSCSPRSISFITDTRNAISQDGSLRRRAGTPRSTETASTQPRKVKWGHFKPPQQPENKHGWGQTKPTGWRQNKPS